MQQWDADFIEQPAEPVQAPVIPQLAGSNRQLSSDPSDDLFMTKANTRPTADQTGEGYDQLQPKPANIISVEFSPVENLKARLRGRMVGRLRKADAWAHL
jgi:hypothetical protein